MSKVVILGGGITGLTLAYELLKKNIQVTILEKENYVGGQCASINHNGNIFDYGPHGYFIDDPKISTLLKKMTGKNYNIIKKNVKIKFKGKYFQYPLDPVNIFLNMNLWISFTCLIQLVWRKFINIIIKPKDISGEKWIINRFGNILYKIYFEEYTEKVWGIHPQKLSPMFTQSRIPEIQLIKSIILFIKKIITLNKIKIKGITFFYPQQGSEVITEALKKEIKKRNGKIILNADIKKIKSNNNKTIAVYKNDKKKTMEIKADYLVSTIPINTFISKFEKINKKIKNNAKRFKFRAIILVNLIVKKKPVLTGLWYYYRDKIFNRLSEINKFSHHLVKDKNTTGLIAELTCNKNDKLWKMKPSLIYDKVLKDILKEKLIRKNDVIDYFVVPIEHGYPIWSLDYNEEMLKIFDYINSIKNIKTIGRQGLFRYYQVDDCIHSAISLVKNIQDYFKKQKIK